MGVMTFFLKHFGALASPPPRTGANVWYFSYGSNMNAKVFCKRRKITAQAILPATLPGYVLSFAYDGIPYLEPAFATCCRRDDAAHHNAHANDDDDTPDVHGVAFLVTRGELTRILATEGGLGWGDCGGYRLHEAAAVGYDGRRLTVATLVGGPVRGPPSLRNRPSARYMRLCVAGAKANNLRKDYVAWLETRHATYAAPAAGQPRARRVAAAQFLFNVLSIPLMLVYGVAVPVLVYPVVLWLCGEPGF